MVQKDPFHVRQHRDLSGNYFIKRKEEKEKKNVKKLTLLVTNVTKSEHRFLNLFWVI